MTALQVDSSFFKNDKQPNPGKEKGQDAMETVNKTRDPTQFTNLEDTSIIAFLKLRGHVTKPWVSYDDPSNPRVSFDIEGDQEQIEKDLQAFYANEQVRILDYVRYLKEIKSILYQMKRLRKT